jgi:hypothetical protein
MKCRFCEAPLSNKFLDLGFAPPSNSYLVVSDLLEPEKYYPLRVKVCQSCWLVQTEDYAEARELFNSNYAYFSSISTSFVEHARLYCDKMIQSLNLDEDSFVIEIASNDGYLLKNFVRANIPCLGIEPTNSTADAAEKLNIPVMREFFSEKLGRSLSANGKQANLIVGNNVYAHVPDIKDFTFGLREALAPDGTITLEFPHLMRLIEHTQFDTVYHEHFSYLSLTTVCAIFEQANLRIFDVEQLQTHGGSIRVYGCHMDDERSNSNVVADLLSSEADVGLLTLATYDSFQSRANQIKNNLLQFLIEQQAKGKKVIAYGAAAKGNTLLNFAGIKPDLLPAVCDAAPSKQGKFMPGSHIPIVSPLKTEEMRPDFILILPWNIKEEIVEQMSSVCQWDCKFVVAVPQLKIIDVKR